MLKLGWLNFAGAIVRIRNNANVRNTIKIQVLPSCFATKVKVFSLLVLTNAAENFF